MLSLVLILVLVALGLLVTALVTASSLWAWLSIGASALAAAALLVDWLRRRAQQRTAARGAGETSDVADESAADDGTRADESAAAGEGVEVASATAATADTPESAESAAERAETAEQTPESAASVERAAAPRHDPHTPPGEEDTDAADLLAVSELHDEVLVIDEQPRYHLAECGWLFDKDTIPIAVSEARELGFTPCARCGPDAALVARVRKKQKRSLGKFGRE